MTDTVSVGERSRIMSAVKSRGNKSTELRLVQLFKECGIKGWRRRYVLMGNPDFVFPKERLAIFVDGCFWHGCKKHCRIPETNRDYWVAKVNKNRKRDKLVNKTLRIKKWTVIRIWEHDLKGERNTRYFRKIKNHVKQAGLSENIQPGLGF